MIAQRAGGHDLYARLKLRHHCVPLILLGATLEPLARKSLQVPLGMAPKPKEKVLLGNIISVTKSKLS